MMWNFVCPVLCPSLQILVHPHSVSSFSLSCCCCSIQHKGGCSCCNRGHRKCDKQLIFIVRVRHFTFYFRSCHTLTHEIHKSATNRKVVQQIHNKSNKWSLGIITRAPRPVFYPGTFWGEISPKTSNPPPKNLRRGLLLCECNTCKLTECSKLTK